MEEKSEIKNNVDNTKREEGLSEEIEIPEGILTNLEENTLVMKKDSRELRKKIHPLINIEIHGNKIVISAKRKRRTEKRLFGTFKAHIKNMIKGLTEGFSYKLQIANIHFPMNVSYDEENNELVVKNFLGEKKERRIRLMEGVDVKINKDVIELESCDIEKAGICVTNIEKGVRVRNKDRRVFQDGIFLVEKPGRSYL